MDSSHAQPAESHEESLVTYGLVFIALMILLAATVLVYYVNLGPLNLPLALAIAVVKAAMVLLIFMHIRLSPRLVWIFSTAAFLWLTLMIAGFKNDYASRPMDAPQSHDAIDYNSPTVPLEHAQGRP